MDIIKVADHIIDLGLEGGNGGGTILCEGTPEEIIKNDISFTSKFLKEELKGVLKLENKKSKVNKG